MIIYTKNSFIVSLPVMTAYEDGVFVFPFFGDESYTDPHDSSVWTWEGVTNDIEQVLAVTYRGVMYLPVSSLADCKSTEQSFFWDDANGDLYVHHTNAILDFTYGSTERKYANLINGYATDYNDLTNNVYDSVYYETRIQSFSEITRSVDPLQFGLISFDQLNYDLVNQDSTFDDYTRNQSVGSPFFVYAVNFGESPAALTSTYQIFQGYHQGSSNNRQALSLQGVETRYFEDKPACQNEFTTAEFTNIGDIEGSLKPVAFGKIRRGIAVPVNIGSLSDASGTVTLLLADPAIDSISSVSKVYDKDGNELTITGTDLTACTVDVTKPAGVNPDETKEYTWQGVGYAISVSSGTVNNGLNIIKTCFLHYNNYLYNTDFFDTTQWDAQTLLKTEEVGISVQSDKGWIEEILQPITTSLQGVVEFQGNGKLTFWSRDTDAVQTPIEYLSIMEDTSFETKDELVTEILVQYAPNFKTDNYLDTLLDSEKEYVINNYNVNRRGDISPFKTVLYNEADAQTIANILMDVYKDPPRYYDLTLDGINSDLNLFDIISWNDERYFNNGTIDKAGEILEITYNYIDEVTRFKVREVPYIDVDFFSILQANGEPIYTTDYEDLTGVETNG